MSISGGTPAAPASGETLVSWETPVSWALRLWLAVEVGFGLAAILAIYLYPEETDTNFAWTIVPPVTAAVMGAFYAATGVTLVASLFVRSWERVRVIILPSLVFTTLELAVTLVHWDRFKVGTAPFYVWFASYLLPPPIFAFLYWWQQRRASSVRVGITEPLPDWVRRLFLANGVALVTLFGLTLVAPQLFIAAAPWMFTPLTARALSAWIISLGLLLLSMVAEDDWPRARLATLMPLALGPTLVSQLARFGAGVRWDDPSLIVFLADVLLLSATCAWLWLRPRPG
jgi:hypothetical protein